jgi:hypothetical protein
VSDLKNFLEQKTGLEFLVHLQGVEFREVGGVRKEKPLDRRSIMPGGNGMSEA